MKLVAVTPVLDRMNLSNTVAANNPTAVNSAIEGATTYLESLLRTPLAVQTRVDYFSYRPGTYSKRVANTKLWLSQSFLVGQGEFPIEVYYSEDDTPITDIGTLTALNAADYEIDLERGSVFVDVAPPKGRAVIAVRYKAGYVDENDVSIPEWLKQGAIAAAIMQHYINTVTPSKKDNVTAKKKSLSWAVYSAVNEYIFSKYGGLSPVRTIIE